MKGKTENIHPDLVAILQELEVYIGFELTVTSGHRTVEHNADPKVGGVPGSEHTYEPAEGADILCKQSQTRYKIVAWLLNRGVTRIGIGNDFIHVGIAKDKPQHVMWDYYPEATA